jgi:hypothetical protein
VTEVLEMEFLCLGQETGNLFGYSTLDVKILCTVHITYNRTNAEDHKNIWNP